MRTIAASLWMSLDGVVEAPETWAFAYSNDEVQAVNMEGMAASDAMLLGRTTYQLFAGYWPLQPDDNPIAKYINATPKYVVSNTLESVEWQNSTLIGGDVYGALADLKRQSGKTITVVGSATLVRSLLDNDLLDELQLSIPPVVRGSGKRLFVDEDHPMPLKLVDSRTFTNGVLYLTYQPVGRQASSQV